MLGDVRPQHLDSLELGAAVVWQDQAAVGEEFTHEGKTGYRPAVLAPDIIRQCHGSRV